ncbi:membrane protein insertase YidC [Rubrivivax rivuli]|uniref:Membrane protein insertase YidC n=1 Tax=Rubrivivax rivuli TaxID=1862385 RepID=A0A437RRJ5_9BURK|nr:membrane protein insertase YidC [Rubrivivax rivuli]RVU49413.1 membrane protein insertase YidC [Rubrivivax rivuli]
MNDIRRTLLWVVFGMSLVLIYDAWQKHTGHGSLFGGPAPRPVAAAGSSPGMPAGSGVPAPAAVPAAAGAAPTAPGLPTAAPTPTGERVTITTDVVKAVFESQGGNLVYLELLGYKDGVDPKRNVVLLDQSPKRLYVAQTGLVAATPGVALPNHFTQMTVVPGERTLAAGAKTLALRFESPLIDGHKLAKTYTFTRGEYTVGVKHEFSNQGTAPIAPQVYLQLARDGNPPEGESSFYFTFTGPAMYTDAAKFTKIDFKDIAKGSASHEKAADNGWVAMVQHYFASAWLVKTPGAREFRTAKVSDNHYTIAMVQPLGTVAPGASATHEAVLFAGPQEEKKLAALAPGLELVKDYGWLTVLSKPLFWLLDKLHGVLGNWGWAIVGLVVLLKIAFYWLNASAYRSMAKMKAVAPRVTELRERYKDKPQEMQQAMMKIYREEKVNPLGGCLPILVQMPFFIALYWVLLSSVEMRGAPWIGWIQDLSAIDPWFILPVLMTASSLFQVWLNPAPPDPMQAKLMWIMPLAFGFMFFFFPAGLVLYWLTNNILSIAQQWFINKQLGVLGK